MFTQLNKTDDKEVTVLEEKPELISLSVANSADLSCPGCKVSPVLD